MLSTHYTGIRHTNKLSHYHLQNLSNCRWCHLAQLWMHINYINTIHSVMWKIIVRTTTQRVSETPSTQIRHAVASMRKTESNQFDIRCDQCVKDDFCSFSASTHFADDATSTAMALNTPNYNSRVLFLLESVSVAHARRKILKTNRTTHSIRNFYI